MTPEEQKQLLLDIHILKLMTKFATIYQKAIYGKLDPEMAAEDQYEMIKKWLVGYEDLKK